MVITFFRKVSDGISAIFIPEGDDPLFRIKSSSILNKLIEVSNVIEQFQLFFKPISVPATRTGYGQLFADKDDLEKPKWKKGDGTVIDLTAGGGGGGAPLDALYVALAANASLTNERVLAAGTNIAIVDGGANGPVTLNVPDASTTTKGAVQLATSGESTAGEACQSNDARLSDARSPLAHTHVKADVTDFAHAASHLSNGSDAIAQATTTVRGTVELATDGESAANLVPQANDARLSDARTPLAHTHVEADITDLSIETAKIENDAVTYAKMQNVSAASKLLGRGDSGAGDPQEITLGTNLSITGTTLNASGGGGGDNVSVNGVAATNADFDDATPAAPTDAVNVKFQKDALDPTNISAYVDVNAVTNKIAADMAGNTVKANNAATSGDPVDVSIGANTVLGRKGSNIVAETVDTAQITGDAITFAKMQNIGTDKLIGRDTAATGDPEEIGLNASLEFDGAGNIQRAALTGDVSASANGNATTIADNAVSNAKAADMAANTVKVRDAGTSGDPNDLAVGASTVVGRGSAGNIVAAAIETSQIAADAVTFAKLQNIATDKLLGRDTAATGDPEEIGLDDTLEFDGVGNIRRAALTGDVTAPAGDNATTIAADAVSNAKLANAAANTVKGNATASSDNPTDIAIGADTVLGRKSGNIVAETIATAQIGDDQVTYAKIQNVASDDVFLGRISGAGGNIEELTPTQATSLLNAFTDALKGLVPASGGGTANFLRADGQFAAPPAGGTVDTLPEDISFSAMITPSQITADQNDYNPTNWAQSWAMRLSTDASRNITGLTKTTTGRLALLINEGTNPIVLVNDSASSTATNRFKFGYGQNITLRPEKCVLLWHDATDDRWRDIGGNWQVREELAAQWYQSSTKTNIGTSYVDIYTQTGSEGKPVWIDFTGRTHYRVIAYWNKIGAGTQQLKFCDVANPTTNILHNFSNILSNENDSGITALPSFAASGGRFEIKMMALSSTGTDDPVFENAIITLI